MSESKSFTIKKTYVKDLSVEVPMDQKPFYQNLHQRLILKLIETI